MEATRGGKGGGLETGAGVEHPGVHWRWCRPRGGGGGGGERAGDCGRACIPPFPLLEAFCDVGCRCFSLSSFPPTIPSTTELTRGVDKATALSVVRLLGSLADNSAPSSLPSTCSPFRCSPSLTTSCSCPPGASYTLGPRGGALPHFASLGLPCPPRHNLCDYFVQLVTNVVADGSQPVTWRPEVAWAEREAVGMGASAVVAAVAAATAANAAAAAGAASPSDAVPPKGCWS